ncbi:MAG: ketopantoate reductase family protein [Alphaproteobacteria bacterium]|nr:ketopantoate reductase family protein [Alphaproteobacteria bacterium]
MSDKRIAVLGAGANGAAFGADMVNAGCDVTFIDQWPAHVEAMRTDGLRVEMPDGAVVTRVDAYHLCDVATMTAPFDIVFLLVKAYDTRWACELIKPYLAEDGLLVGIQNAMMQDDIAEIVGPARTLGCVVELSSEIFTPGEVQRNTPPSGTWFGIGALGKEAAGREQEIADILQHAGKVSITDQIVAAKWMKLVVNTMCLGPFAMMGLTLYEAMKIPGMREFALQAGTEALTAGQSIGHSIQPIFGLNEEDVRDTNRLLEKLLDKLAADIGPAARDCVLQDHLKGRYSEVDLINGLVVEELAERGGKAPVNAAIAEITRRIQTGELEPDPSNLELAQDLARA